MKWSPSFLCVPSMDVIQRRFKSSVYRMNIEEQKKLLAMKRTTRGQLREGDRPWEGRLWESRQATNRNLIRGRQSRKSWHNTAKSCHSALEVNEALGWWRITLLPGEISSTCGRVYAAAQLSAMASVIGEKSAEVILAETTNRSARSHSKVADVASVKDRTQTMKRPEHPSITMKPTGGVKNGYGIRAEKETSCVETELPEREFGARSPSPDGMTFRNRRATDPYGRW